VTKPETHDRHPERIAARVLANRRVVGFRYTTHGDADAQGDRVYVREDVAAAATEAAYDKGCADTHAGILNPDPAIDALVKQERDEGRAIDVAAGLREGWHKDTAEDGWSRFRQAEEANATLRDALEASKKEAQAFAVTIGCALGHLWASRPDEAQAVLAEQMRVMKEGEAAAAGKRP
jgi:lambda repressor-like predicted transcriptional regulator